MSSRDLVVCSLEPWDEVWRRNQYLVSGLLSTDRHKRVLFVEPPVDPSYQLSRRRRPTRARGLRCRPDVAGGRLWTYQQTKIGPRRLGPAVDHALSAGVVRTCRRLSLDSPILWINDPSRAPLLVRTGWPALYDITDDWLAADRGPNELARLRSDEDTLMRRCAAVVVCSSHLQRVKGAVRPVVLIPNAVDVPRYQRPEPRPGDLPVGPTAMYVGTMHEDRLDVDLCVRTARRLVDIATMVFVGPNALTAANTARLQAEANVVLLGSRAFDAIPAYLQHASVLVVPHVVTEFTDSLDPIKLYEYLAVGRPVVSTPVSGFRDVAGPVTVASGDAFAAAVAEQVRTDASTIDRVADLPTWDSRVEQMRAVLDGVEPRRMNSGH